MFCPYCGNEVRENEKFCQSCGAQLPSSAQEASTAVQQTEEIPAQSFTPARASYDSLKDFILSPDCPEKLRKSLKSNWIVLLVCAALTLIFELMSGMLPIDAILLVACAFWLRSSYSMTPAIIALALGVLSIIVGFAQNGTPSGVLIAIAGGSAVSNLLRAKQLFKAHQEGTSV